MAWLALMAERETGGVTSDATAAPATQSLVVLCRDEFAGAVRAALRDLQHADALHGNPLLQARVVAQHSDANASVAARAVALQTLLKQAIESL